MKKFNRKGFTLVELLVTIVLLGVVATIIIYNMTSVSNSTKESDYEKFVAGVKSAASVYADTNPEVFNDLYVNRAYLYITIKDLVTNGLYSADEINPYTEEKVDFDEIIKANLDSTSGQIVFEYPLTNQEQETFLVAIADYIAWGEPYTNNDCMYGAGSYQLALSTEAGDLIDISDPAQVNKYHITCQLPDDFDNKKEGTYKITYTWLTESGTKKSAKRDLRVMPQVVPTFKTNYEYTFDTWYTPSYNTSTKAWTTLRYTPYVEQASEETTFTITKKKILPTTGTAVTVVSNSKNFNADYAVDDGAKEYTISAIIYGHHNNSYSYTATNTVVMRSRLIIPETFISGGTTKWNNKRTFTIENTYSPVGVDKYEFKLLTASGTVNNDAAVNTTNTFAQSVAISGKLINLSSVLACSNSDLSYPYIAFRAINKDGYVGDWVVYKYAYITNLLSKIMETECSSCSTTYCSSTGTNSCAYKSKYRYLSYGGKKFVVLEKFSDGSMLVSLDGVTSQSYSPMTIKNGTYTYQTCDGTTTVKYTTTAAVLSTLQNAAQDFLNALPSNYASYLVFYTWPAGNTAYVGNIDRAMFSKYGSALAGSTYWTTSQLVTSKSVASGRTTVSESFFYYVSGSSADNVGYAGQSLPIKPILKMRNVYTCGGSGTSSDPYVIKS